ncbi:MAG: hypothetical protein ACOY4I_05665 [Bacillota bacterium]
MISGNIMSRSILRYMWYLFGNPVQFNPITLEITFIGSRQSVREAISMLDRKRVWYDISWVHIEGESYPSGITLQLDEISLKR